MVEHTEAASTLPCDGHLARRMMLLTMMTVSADNDNDNSNGYLVGVPHEGGDVVPDPDQCEPLVQQPLVTGGRVQAQAEEA